MKKMKTANSTKTLRKSVKTLLAGVAVLIMCAALAGCRYVSSYKALCLVTSEHSDSGYMSFSSFEGTKVFTFNVDEDENIDYRIKVTEGSLTLSYDSDGEKKEIVTAGPGDVIDGFIEKPGDGKVYVIIETDGECSDGKVEFEVN